MALLIHLGIRYSSEGELAPAPGIIVTHFIVSLWGITWARLYLRFLRESHAAKAAGPKPRLHRVAIVGAGELGTRVALDLLSRDDVPTEVVALFEDDPRSWNRRPYDIPVIGMPECLLNAEWSAKVDEVIIALPQENKTRLKEIEALLTKAGIKVAIAPEWRPLQAAMA